MENEFNKLKVSMMINYIITIITFIGLVFMYADIRFMDGTSPILETSSIGMFKFFTVQSNILIGISALLFANKERNLISGKIKKIPRGYYIFKYISTIAITLTFLVVFAYLARIVQGGAMSLLMNSNLFFHLITPVLSILTFVLFEKTEGINFKYVFYGLIPVIIYAIFYMTNIIIHLEDGKVSPKYDWYWFVQGGIMQSFYVIPGILMITLAISLGLYFLNKKK